MSMFTFAVSCLTTSNLPWFTDLTFQVPMQYCSLRHQTWLLSPVTCTTVLCFCFGSISSFFLELFLCPSPVVYWAPTDLGSSSLSVISFSFFILFMRFSKQEHWSGLPFPFPVDHALSELSTMTPQSWLALNNTAHSFIGLYKTGPCDQFVFILLALWGIMIRGLWNLPDGREWLGEIGSCPDGWGHVQ